MIHLSRDGNFDLDTRLQANARLKRERLINSSNGTAQNKLTICLTISLEECKSMRRLWTFNSKRSHVLEPSPQG